MTAFAWTATIAAILQKFWKCQSFLGQTISTSFVLMTPIWLDYLRVLGQDPIQRKHDNEWESYRISRQASQNAEQDFRQY